MTRAIAAPARRRPPTDSGFTLIEVIVALFLLGVVATAVLVFFIKGVQTTTHLQRDQSAGAVAMQYMEQVRSVSPVAPSGGVSGILAGRSQTAVLAAWGSAASADTVDSDPAYDFAATALSIPTVPIQKDVVVSLVTYHVTTLIGYCYRPTSSTGADQTCLPSPATGVKILRVTVVVTWKPSSPGQCSGSTLCSYRTRSLVDPTADATWNLTVKPVAYDDTATITATSSYQDFAWVANDVLGPVLGNPVFGITGVSDGTAVPVSSASAPWLIRYTPNGSSSGIDTFTYQLRDGAGRVSNAATVTLNVTPVTVNSSTTAIKGTTTWIDLSSFVHGTATASDAVTIMSGPSTGSIPSTNGLQVQYVAPASGTSAASFTYSVTDDSGLVSNVATVSVTLKNPVVVPPTAPNLSYDIAADKALPITVTALNILTQAGVTGADPGSTIWVVSGPSHGTVTGSTTAALTYTPTINTAGVDTFTYYIQTSTGVKSLTPYNTVTLRVNPKTVNDSFSGKHGQSATINVLSNDTPATGMVVSIASTTCSGVSVVSNQVKAKAPSTAGNSCTVVYTATSADGLLSATATLNVTAT